jgi:hypothetical protein
MTVKIPFVSSYSFLSTLPLSVPHFVRELVGNDRISSDLTLLVYSLIKCTNVVSEGKRQRSSMKSPIVVQSQPFFTFGSFIVALWIVPDGSFLG